jgi:hypothetical protein
MKALARSIEPSDPVGDDGVDGSLKYHEVISRLIVIAAVLVVQY